MSDLNYLSRIIADVECKSVSAEPGMGRYRLLFHLTFGRRIWADNLVPGLSALRVVVKWNGLVVGTAIPVGEDFLMPRPPKNANAVPVTLTFALEIDASTLERIEHERNGAGVTFQLEVIGTARVLALHNGGASDKVFPSLPPPLRIEPLAFEPQLSTAEISHRVSQSDWIELLGRLGYSRILLFEIPWPSGNGGALQDARTHFESARDLFLSSDYKQCVAELRDSLNAACTEMECGKFDWSVVKNANSREDMNLQERFLLAWSSVRILTHSAHHGENFSREEARYILGMAALALSLAARAPGVLRRAAVPAEQGHDEAG